MKGIESKFSSGSFYEAKLAKLSLMNRTPDRHPAGFQSVEVGFALLEVLGCAVVPLARKDRARLAARLFSNLGHSH